MTVTSESLVRYPPCVLGFDGAAVSTLPLPKAQLDAAFKPVQSIAYAKNRKGNRFSSAEQACDWLAIASSALITLITGFFWRVGEVLSPGEAPDLLSVPQRNIRIITTLAAIGAVSVAVSSAFQTEKTSAYSKADEIVDAMRTTRTLILRSNDAVAARAHLDTMVLQAER